MRDAPPADLSLAGVRAAYADGLDPAALLDAIRRRAAGLDSHRIFIHLLDEAEQRPHLERLASLDPATASLWGVPFVMKDNMDLAGVPTTAACEAFARVPDANATVVQRMLDAGALPVGKTNLDQFATGLNGTRSPWGACRNSHDPEYISGGSSSGSAVAVALGLASFGFGTDTAGSGRVPAGFNNLVGLKPTRGLVPNTGVVPACRSLDCVSTFALHVDDANAVLAVAEGIDPDDGYSRANRGDNAASRYGRRAGPLAIGVPDAAGLRFFGDDAYEAAWRATLDALSAADASSSFVEIDYAPFDEAARLLYEGPWVAERYVATLPLIETDPDALFPVVRDIIAGGEAPRATALFRAQYRLEALRRTCAAALDGVDCLMTPSAGRLFTIDEMLAEPVRRNSELGHYTNFVNLLDMAALALPAGFTPTGLPFGVTLSAAAFGDRALLSIGNRLATRLAVPLGAAHAPAPALASTPVGPADRTELLVCGAHMRGLPLNGQLVERGARFLAEVRTAPAYRLHALDGEPARPGLVRVADGGVEIAAELWSVPNAELGGFVAAVPAPLGIGRVALEGGREVPGFLCEAAGVAGARDVSAHGGWRAWLSSSAPAAPG